MELDSMKINGCLSITTENGQSRFKVKGTGEDILFNWIALTYLVCRDIGIPAELLASDLPAAVRNYEQIVQKKQRYRNPDSAKEGAAE